MTEHPVLSCPLGEASTALDSILQILGGLAELFEETDSKIARGLYTPLEQAICADFMPGLGGLARAAAQIGVELEAERSCALLAFSEAGLSVKSPLHGPSNVLAQVLKLRGVGNAIVAALLPLFDAAEAEAIGLDRASAALCTGTAFIDRVGRVIAKAGSESPAET